MFRQSDSIAKLAPALVKANAEVQHAVKDSTNPHFKSKFASLNAVVDTIKPVYAAHGLTFVQIPGLEEGHATLDTMILHESGEWLAGTSGSPLQRQDPQGVGSALTYLRRYALAAIAGIGQEDDDGNAATQPVKRRNSTKAEAAALAKEVTDLLNESNGKLPEKGRKMCEGAVDTKNPEELRAAVAWINEQNPKAVPA